MDFCRNISVSGGGVPAEFEPEKHLFSPSTYNLASLDDLFYGINDMEEGDMNLEWLSIFVEDCLSSSGNCIPPSASLEKNTKGATLTCATNTKLSPLTCATNTKLSPLSKPQKTILHKFSIPCKARSKRPRNPIGTKARRSHHHYPNDNIHLTSWSNNALQIPTNDDPPLLQQAYWLADSELILPKKQEQPKKQEDKGIMGMMEKEEEDEERGSVGSLGSLGGNSNTYTSSTSNENGDGGGQFGQQQQQAARRCTHCLSHRTPQWRAGPLGPKTLCNACGVRYKSGRLLPEYRPAKSPTFVSYKHSNSHKKVLEMRTMSLLSSDSSHYSS